MPAQLQRFLDAQARCGQRGQQRTASASEQWLRSFQETHQLLRLHPGTQKRRLPVKRGPEQSHGKFAPFPRSLQKGVYFPLREGRQAWRRDLGCDCGCVPWRQRCDLRRGAGVSESLDLRRGRESVGVEGVGDLARRGRLRSVSNLREVAVPGAVYAPAAGKARSAPFHPKGRHERVVSGRASAAWRSPAVNPARPPFRTARKARKDTAGARIACPGEGRELP